MKWSDVERNWSAMVPAITSRWPETNAEDVAAIDGSRDALNIYLGQVSGLTPQEASEAVDEWLAGPLPADAVMDETNDNAQIDRSAAHVPEGGDVLSEDGDFGDDRVPQTPIGRG